MITSIVYDYQKGSGKEVDPAYGKPSLIFISDLSLMGTCYHLPAFMSSIFYKIILIFDFKANSSDFMTKRINLVQHLTTKTLKTSVDIVLAKC